LTAVVGDNMLKVVAWYDNEWGYSNRLVEVVADVGKLLQKTDSPTPPVSTESARIEPPEEAPAEQPAEVQPVEPKADQVTYENTTSQEPTGPQPTPQQPQY